MGRSWVKLVQKHDVGKNSTNFQNSNLYQIVFKTATREQISRIKKLFNVEK